MSLSISTVFKSQWITMGSMARGFGYTVNSLLFFLPVFWLAERKKGVQSSPAGNTNKRMILVVTNSNEMPLFAESSENPHRLDIFTPKTVDYFCVCLDSPWLDLLSLGWSTATEKIFESDSLWECEDWPAVKCQTGMCDYETVLTKVAICFCALSYSRSDLMSLLYNLTQLHNF